MLAVASLLLTAGCSATTSGESGGEAGEQRELYTPGMLSVVDGGTPQAGGTLSISAQGEPATLDPTKNIYSASTAGTEMTAIFDVLMRWDIESGDLVPQLAESLETNDDNSVWTLKLRPGVKFSDGTDVDAAAVKWSIERYIEKKGTEHALLTRNLTSIDATDTQTVTFTLNTSWGGFGNMLASGPGLIVAEASDASDPFAPIGAGPFVFEKQAPQEELVLAANQDYWNGAPNLEKVRFIYLNDQVASLESLQGGSVGVSLLSLANVVEDALNEGYGGYLNIVSISNVALINAAPDRPGNDPRVRQALQLGLDTELIRNRAYEGAGASSTDVFSPYSVWATDGGLGFDPERAKELVDAAKADGFDGKITYKAGQDPTSRAVALSIKASLESVGFIVEIDYLRSIADTITAIAVERDYDVAGWGISLRDSDPGSRMFAALHSEGTLTHGVHTGPEMDAIIEEFQSAGTIEEQRAILVKLQAQWNEDVPALIFGPKAEFFAWDTESLRGVEGTATSVILLGDAWLE